MRKLAMGFLGCGNIGSGTYRLLGEMHDELMQRLGVDFAVKKVLVRNPSKPRNCSVPREKLTCDPEDILSDDEISIVCEFMGGENPAWQYMKLALEQGKTVVTANKMALCLHMAELMDTAKRHNAALLFEASVCGAIPVISCLTSPLMGNRIGSIMGIINGTTNYILTRMAQENAGYEQVLSDAQTLGLAEPDPSSDVEGTDAAYKLAIMASLAFHSIIRAEDIHTEGITHVTQEDIAYGQQLGYVLKLLAIGKAEQGNVEVRVHPTFLPKEHPLAQVDGSYNAVFLEGNACGKMMLEGIGAGDYPTASAILGDIISAVYPPKYPDFSDEIAITHDWESRYFIHLSATDAPGVLEQAAGALARENVSIQTMLQKGKMADGRVPLILITHPARELSLQNALTRLNSLPVCHVESMIRVEGM